MDEAIITEIMFADDIEFISLCPLELQNMMTIFDKIVTDFGGKINTVKTKVMMIVHAIRDRDVERPVITVQGVVLKCVKEFVYLGTLETELNKLDGEIMIRCQRMRASYYRHAREIFQGRLRMRTKVNLFNTMVVTNGLYGCQVWNLTAGQLGQLESTFFSLIRSMFRWKRRDWSRGDIIRFGIEKEMSIYPMEWRVAKLQLRYLAHEMRISPGRVPRLPHTMMLRAEIKSDKRRTSGRGPQQYQEAIRRAAKACNITDMKQLLEVSSNKLEFNKLMEGGAKQYFLQNWMDKEDQLKAGRREYELRRQENARNVVLVSNSIMQQVRIEYGNDEEGDEEAERERAESVDDDSEEDEWEASEVHRTVFEDEATVDRGSRDRRSFLEDYYDVRMGGLWDENDEGSGRAIGGTQLREDHQVGVEKEANERLQQVVDGVGGPRDAEVNEREEGENHYGIVGNNIDDGRDASEFLEFIGAWMRDERVSRHQIPPGSYDPGPVQNHVTRMEGSGSLQMTVHQWIDMEEQANQSSTSRLEETLGREELISSQSDEGQQHQQRGETAIDLPEHVNYWSTRGLEEAQGVGDIYQRDIGQQKSTSVGEEGNDSQVEGLKRNRYNERRRNRRRQKARLRVERGVVGRKEEEEDQEVDSQEPTSLIG